MTSADSLLIGKDLDSIVIKAGLQVENFYPFIVEFNGPIIGSQRLYLERLHNSWYVDDALGILSESDITQWKQHFSSSHVDNVFDSKSTLYIEAEFMVIARRPE